MPGRIAMGATAWWEPVLAVVLTLATIIGLVQLAGRLCTNAILHSGPALSLKNVWRNTTTAGLGPAPARAHATTKLLHRAHGTTGGSTTMTKPDLTSHRLLITLLTGIGVALGVAVAVLTSDLIIGVIAGAGFIGITIQMVKLWTGHSGPPIAHH
jgi:hypothetical protein